MAWQLLRFCQKGSAFEGFMVYLMINWILSTMSLLILVSVVPGFRVSEFQAVLIAAGAVGLLSASLGLILKRFNGLFSVVMSAAFLCAIDTILFRVSALLVPGFAMRGFVPALYGATLLLVLNLVLMRYLNIKEEGFDSESALSH